MTNDMRTSTVLDLAADAIQMAGWAKGDQAWMNHDGKGLCLEGGILAATGLHHFQLHSCPAYRAVREYLAPVLAEASTAVTASMGFSLVFDEPWYFNDRIAETADDVIGVLRAAAAVERLKEETTDRLLGEPRVYEDEDQPLPLDVAV